MGYNPHRKFKAGPADYVVLSILKDDKSEGTKEGAIAGAVIGTAIAGATKGQEVELPAGTPVQVELTSPVTVTL